ncbi:fused MFS/spermidine synthase [Ascidiimonas sp. W6]|uniref:spermidine synthase n=1 Tax=Ascidiimonas meishanensis TaxID=3128903 RepID=UPI0030EF4F3A
MNSRLYVVLYSVTLLLSASLLFVVQPMFSKMILPLLGGTPQVWNTAMLFFQLLLLGGYAYAHGTTKYLSIRVQAILHVILLVMFFFVLPIAIPEGWIPPLSKDPTLWQLSLMTVTIGGPFFVLSGSAPMFQRWFSGTNHKDANNPYFLYGASNLGSMTALLFYPVIIEPAMNLGEQSHTWMYGYMALIVFTIFCALVVWKTNKKKIEDKIVIEKEVITWGRRGKWLLLSFIPSSLMLGVTTYITTDVASVPLLWIIPLALYVSTFIIVFARKPIISEEKSSETFSFLLIFMFVYMILYQSKGIIFVPIHMILFFFAALVCHSALSSSKPSAQKLTEFYLIMSIGGALGGVFNALVTPNLFIIPIEYALVLGLAACMRFANEKQEKTKLYYFAIGIITIVAITFGINNESMIVKGLMTLVSLTGLALIINKRWVFGITVAITLLIAPPGDIWDYVTSDTILQDRNFFGVMRVIDTEDNQRIFVHGTTVHGTQSLEKGYEYTPMAYYYDTSPIADMFKFAATNYGEQKIAVLGLGVGVTACFDRDGRTFDFFEIDPGIIRIAENPKYFTFLSDCGSTYKIIEGDARLTLAYKPDNSYEFILADAYSSDNIPVHLITREAVELYLSKLKPNGLLGFNISNSYLDIEPVLAEIADSFQIKGYAKFSKGKTIEGLEIKSNDTAAFVFARNEQQEKFLSENGWTPAKKRKGVGLWTDSFSNIVGVIGIRTLKKRIEELERKEKKMDE